MEILQWTLNARLEEGQAPPNVALYFSQVVHCLFGRFLFVTEEGQLGLAPEECQPGDVLAVLLGCRSPMVLRSTRKMY